jgi:hypothetical protein
MISSPKRRVPVSNAVGGGVRVRLPAIAPMAERLPVRTTSAVAEPLMTELPMKRAFTALSRPASAGTMPACFSTG